MKAAARNPVLYLAILLFVSSIAVAAGQNKISISKDGHQTTVAHATKPFLSGKLNIPLNLTRLYDNSSKYALGVYWCCNGWTVSGTGSQVGFQAAEAMPFTPSVNATITRIGVAVSYISGDNEIVVSLNADSGGLPGTSLASFTLSNLPALGECCTTEVESVSGVPVTAGTQYWIVVQTTTPSSTTWAAWNENDTNQTTQPFAYQNSQQGSGWIPTEGILGAFGVGGTVP